MAECSKQYTLYILELQNSKYYVGITQNLRQRLEDHKKGCGAQWTIQHKPVRIFWLLDQALPQDEELYTVKMMKYYGINNVRGSHYSQIELTPSQIESIFDKMSSYDNSCFRCGSRTHFSKECHRVDVDICGRCGHEGHRRETCFALKDKNKRPLGEGSDEDDDILSVDDFHREDDTTDDEVLYLRQLKKLGTMCTRCGRKNHTIDKCHASRHLDHRPLAK